MTIEIDRSIYNDACVSKCVYSFLDEASFERKLIGETEVISVSPKFADRFDAEVFRNHFLERLNDYKLRCIIEEETRDLRVLLYAKAFMDSDDLIVE